MKNKYFSLLLATFVMMVVFVLSCENDSGNTTDRDPTCEDLTCPLLSSALTDVNSTSKTYDRDVAPQGFVGWVSGWYFGRST